MRKPLYLSKILLVATFGFLSASIQAQDVKIDAGEAKFDDLESPQLGGNTGVKNFKPKDWLEAEVKLKAEASRRSSKKFLERITVKWYVAVDNPDAKGVFILEKEVTYVNVPVGEDMYASIYISPGAILRLTGSDRAGSSIVREIAGEVTYNGTKVGSFNSRKDEWWRSASASRNDAIPLLSKNETPFKFLWWDRYLEEEVRRR